MTVYVDLNFIGQSASVIDAFGKKYIMEHAKSASWTAKYHLTETFGGAERVYLKGPDGVSEPIGYVIYELKTAPDGTKYIERRVIYTIK